MSRLLRILPWVLAACVALALLGAPDDALARIGGGQGFDRGGGGGRSGGGGGGDVSVDLLILLLHLCIEVPAIGIPLTLIVVGFLVFRAIRSNWGGKKQVHSTHAQAERRSPRRPPRRRGVPGMDRLRRADTGLSVPVLLDFLILVHRRAYGALSKRSWDALAPFVSEQAQGSLSANNEGVTEVHDVVVGNASLVKVEQRGGFAVLHVKYASTRTEVPADGKPRDVYVEELWTFRRASDALSLPPDEALRLGCPSCGVSIETTSLGACRNCDTPITKGQLQWQAVATKVLARRHAVAPTLSASAGGVESSVREPTRTAPDLAASTRALLARHPDLTVDDFQKRVAEVYARLQTAWSAGKWEDARPYVTDFMFQSLRFWIERYTRHGLRNQLTDVELARVVPVKIEVDAWYEAITVRIWGSMKDSIVDRSGKVVGGNAKEARQFSEYWTFLRAAGTGGATKSADQCPSCGAPLDNISQAGVCGYCDSKITTGRFDWVLSRIDQCETYDG